MCRVVQLPHKRSGNNWVQSGISGVKAGKSATSEPDKALLKQEKGIEARLCDKLLL